ncbi:MAG: 3-phosphoglycerate dehydrogenase, partial [Proteobacteria bacterium]|nr:3-phosphoglycerate dehydrogenase [Pseudomonadota bacterium]
MFTYKTFNNIAEEGIATLAERRIAEVADNPDGLILRSHKLVKEEFGNSLSCIARAGAGVNNIPIADATSAGIVVMNTPGANANA